MAIEVSIQGEKVCIDGQPTYPGRVWQGHDISGRLFNSRMIQGLFDDDEPTTRQRWVYPDTGEWDPDRNCNELCAALPEYQRHGVLGMTIGMQGGGSIYTPDVYDHYRVSAFTPEGALREDWLARLRRVLAAADEAGIVVIVSYFYWKQALRFKDEAAIRRATADLSDWLLACGHRNVLVEIVNECLLFHNPILKPDRIHELIELAQSRQLAGRRLLCAASSGGDDDLASGRWREIEDFSMPHGNGCQPEQLAAKIRVLRATEDHRRRPRPIIVNEDSIFIGNLDAAVAAGASWGFYCQGYGSVYKDRFDWTQQARETRHEDLSGFQTLPVNWSINDPHKRAFFDRVLEVTGG